MGLMEFEIGALGELGNPPGIVSAQVNAAIRAAMRDIIARPHDEKPREVMLKIVLWPDPDEVHNDEVDAVVMHFDITSKIPAIKSRDYGLSVREKGTLWFNPESPRTPNQGTIDDEINREENGGANA